MGAWAFGVYQSDDSMDWEAEVYDRSGIEMEDAVGEEHNASIRAALEQHIPDVLEAIQAETRPSDEDAAYQKAVGYQMLACVLMRHGCAVPADVQNQIIAGILACPEYLLAKELQQKSGGSEISRETLLPLEQQNPLEAKNLRNRFNGRLSALSRLAVEFGEYNRNGGVPYNYQDKGALELYGVTEEEFASNPKAYL